MGESVINLGIFGKKKQDPNLMKKKALETLLLAIQGIPGYPWIYLLFRDPGIHKNSGIFRFLINELFI